MSLKPKSMRKRVSMFLAAALAAAFITAVPTVANAATTDPVLLTFEDDDAAGALAVGNAAGAKWSGSFEGSSTVIATPGVARNGKALEFTKTGNPWSGVGIYQAPDGRKLTSSTNPVIILDYFSPDASNSPLMLKLEAAGGNPNLRAAVTAAPGWNRFSVDFSTLSGANGTWSDAVDYKQLALFPNFRDGDVKGSTPDPVANTGQKYFIDNVSFNGATMPAGPATATAKLLTFEDNDADGALVVGNASDVKWPGSFEGASTAIATPGVARNGKALEFTKNGQPWSGINLYKVADGEKLTTSAEPVISFDYFSPDATNSPVMVKLESSGPNLRAALTAVPGWNRFDVDFSALSGANGTWSADVVYKQLALFPNFRDGDVKGDTPDPVAITGQKYFIDNVSFNGAEMPALPNAVTAKLLTFEDNDADGALVVGNASEVKWPGSFEGASTAIATPGVARNGKALEFTKNGQPWSGINLYKVGAGEQLTSASKSVISFDYFSPDATNSPVMVKLESGGPYLRAVVTAVPGWNRFSVDFSTLSGANGTWSADVVYKQLALFPNFRDGDVKGDTPDPVAITGQKYFIDNVSFNGAAMPEIPVDEVDPPVASGPATFAGTQKFKATLTMTPPTFTGDAAEVTYSWWRCKVSGAALSAVPSPADKCTVIPGANKATYRIKALDRARYIRGAVTATNEAGTVYAVTKTTKRISY